jgi:hypothetical protein
MAAELVRAARNENDCELERLRLDFFYFNYRNENVKIFIHCTEKVLKLSFLLAYRKLINCL